MSNQTPGNVFGLPTGEDPNESDQNQDTPANGDRLGDKYVILDIHRGGMGEVYICDLVQMPGTPIALKTFQKRFFLNRANREAFVREASIWLRLSGLPHIMPAFGLEHIEGRPFVRMYALMPSPDQAVSVRDILSKGPLEPMSALDMATQIALGMRSAAEKIAGLVHGDLKPENLLLFGPEAMISDFGLARAISNWDANSIRLEGTWAYQAPECWNANAAAGVKSDIYAFGVIIYEFLTGGLPFRESTREGWARAHKELAPTPPATFCIEGLAGDLMEVALGCLRKNPDKRPESFGDLFERLTKLALSYDFMAGAEILRRRADAVSFYRNMRQHLLDSRISGLLELGDYVTALAEYEDVPEDQLNGRLWSLKGSALSLNGCDEEAIACFTRAMEEEITDEQRWMTKSEYALSLKRLKRFDEAIEVYYELIVLVPDSMTDMVHTNLASVYLESGQPKEVIKHLEPLIRRQRIHPKVWAILGQAYQSVERYEEAARAYQAAVSLSPELAIAQLGYAEVCMDHLGLIEEAWTALDLLFDQGYMSREWLIRSIACNIILGRREIVDALMSAVKRDLTSDQATEFEKEAMRFTVELMRKLANVPVKDIKAENGSGDEPIESTHSSTETEEQSLYDRPTSETGQAESRLKRMKNAVTFQMPEEEQEVERTSLQAPPRSDINIRDESEGITLPFLNIRYYVDQQMHSIDFYQDTDVADYIEDFEKCWRQATRDPRMQMGGSQMLSNPPYFTGCPKCNMRILTNRDHGTGLRCRNCETRHQTHELNDPEFGVLLSGVLGKLGKEVIDLSGQMQILLVQPLDASESNMVEELCSGNGFTPFPIENPITSFLLAQGEQRLNFDFNEPFFAWQKAASSGAQCLRGETAPEIERLVRDLRVTTGGVRTMSMIFDPADQSMVGLTLTGRKEELVEQLRQAVRSDPTNMGLVLSLAQVLVSIGALEEAREKAQTAVRIWRQESEAWETLGIIELDCGDAQASVTALNKALEFAPAARKAMFFLARAYEQLGEGEKAEELYARCRSLGGPLSTY